MPSQADVAVFEAVSGPPPADLFHALRWYNHIKSYEKEKASLPGVKKSLGKYGPASVEDTTGSAAADVKDDDDIDLFGSDDEEVWLTSLSILIRHKCRYYIRAWVQTLTGYMMNKTKSPSFG